MSFSVRESRSFLGPLKGKASTFVVADRRTNLVLARSLVALHASAGQTCGILDLDALYSSNAIEVFGGLGLRPGAVKLQIPSASSRIENDFPAIFAAGTSTLVVDTLNTLFHALSFDEGAYRSRKLSFAVASLSYTARSAGTAAILSMYRREGLSRKGAGRSISNLSDVTVSVETAGDELQFHCDRGEAWPEGEFSIRIP